MSRDRRLTTRDRFLLLAALVFAVAAGIWLATSRGEQRAYDVPDPFASEVIAQAASVDLPLPPAGGAARDEQLSKIAAADAQRMWSELFTEAGLSYEPATITTFRGPISTKCGAVETSVGPFYCPAEAGIFLDLALYDDMQRGLGPQADFAWAYVIAHEIAHHVQWQTGVLQQVNQLRGQAPDAAAGDQGPSVRSELQADCYAGVWIHGAYRAGRVGEGDLRGAIAAAQTIGDDNLQGRVGEVRPDTFTHGSSEQRVRWLTRGVDTGQPAACDTFSLPLV